MILFRGTGNSKVTLYILIEGLLGETNNVCYIYRVSLKNDTPKEFAIN
jgi:hypothetical protein